VVLESILFCRHFGDQPTNWKTGESLSDWCKGTCCGLTHGLQNDPWVHPASHPKNIRVPELEGKTNVESGSHPHHSGTNVNKFLKIPPLPHTCCLRGAFSIICLILSVFSFDIPNCIEIKFQ
jgi:hypothetical protein